MLFALHWSFEPTQRDEINERFKKTGGPPPMGVKMLGRWHSIGQNDGFCVCETDDPVALGKWIQEWSDLMDFSAVPVLDDEGTMKVID